MSRNLILTAIALVAVVVSMIVGTFFVCNTPVEFFVTIGLIGIAIAAGAIIGTAITPFNDGEGRRFISYSKAVGIFLTGYIASKADALVNKIFDPSIYSNISPLWSFRLIAVVAVILSVSKITFAFRSYDYNKSKIGC